MGAMRATYKAILERESNLSAENGQSADKTPDLDVPSRINKTAARSTQ
jgi:hypothetical protein